MMVVFLTTSFGFGPVSKAVTVARCLRAASPSTRIVFVGDGIALDFAAKSEAFDERLEQAVDSDTGLRAALPTLRSADVVVSVLNMAVLAEWCPDTDPPLYLIDSLGWMWNEPDPYLRNAAAYFVQDFLLNDDGGPGQVVIPPIDASLDIDPITPAMSGGHLLVNLSGLSNPIAGNALYERYATALLDTIVPAAAAQYSEVIVCCNAPLAARLRPRYAVKIEHLSHHAFLTAAGSAARVLTAPGITTTVELLSMNVSPYFLPPQNFSQALILQRYSEVLPSDTSVPLYRFGERFRISPAVPEADGVRQVLAHLEEIIEHHPVELGAAISKLLSVQSKTACPLRSFVRGNWSRSGQQVVVDYLIHQRSHAAIGATYVQA